MQEVYSVSFVIFSDGERYPILRDSKGMPHWYATLYATTQIRNASKAPNTIAVVLSAIRLLLAWAYAHTINLEDRFAKKQFLTEQELESLRNYLQCKESDLPVVKQPKKIRKIENIRTKHNHINNKTCNSTQYIRISYIADYVEWLAFHIVEHDAKHIDPATMKLIQRMCSILRFKRPQKANRSRELLRKGINKEQQEALLTLIKPGYLNSPFSERVQNRNQLIILMLYNLGLRAGELLGLRISDFDFQSNTVLIARRHDNAMDVRTYQPVVKTMDRRIPLADYLVKLVTEYVIGDRRKVPGAKRHDYLFVVHQLGPFLGQPISLKGLAKIFKEIQLSDLQFKHLTPHVLRHTANDKFSELMDQRKVSSAEEDKMRSYLMGWKEGSGMASTYTRRHIENKAREAALLLQKPIARNSDVRTS